MDTFYLTKQGRRFQNWGAMGSPGIALLQSPVGRMPATMASHSLFMERMASDGTKVPFLGGGLVRPGELILATVTGIGSFIDPTITFELFDDDGALILRAQKAPSIGSRQVSLSFSAPSVEGVYTMKAWLDNLPFLPFQHDVETSFSVSQDAPIQKPPPGGGGFLGDIKPLAWIALGIVTIMALSPVVKRVAG